MASHFCELDPARQPGPQCRSASQVMAAIAARTMVENFMLQLARLRSKRIDLNSGLAAPLRHRLTRRSSPARCRADPAGSRQDANAGAACAVRAGKALPGGPKCSPCSAGAGHSRAVRAVGRTQPGSAVPVGVVVVADHAFMPGLPEQRRVVLCQPSQKSHVTRRRRNRGRVDRCSGSQASFDTLRLRAPAPAWRPGKQ